MRHVAVKRTLVAAIAILGLAALISGASSAAGGSTLPPELCAPDQNDFTLSIDNGFYPLPVGQQWVLTGEEGGQTISLQITVLNETKIFFPGPDKVTTRVVEEQEWGDTNGNGIVDGVEDLIEVSLNYFAQTQDGTVCYFGEDVDIYVGGVIVSHDGAWRADAPGNAPGIYMPAAPSPGMTFAQENAPGVAEDEATILQSGTVNVPAGKFRDTIKVREFNPLDGDKGYKFYARDVGLIVDGPLRLVSD